MKFAHLLLYLLAVLPVCSLLAQQAAPEKALKYHEALLKHPDNSTDFSSLYDAWINSESLDFVRNDGIAHDSANRIRTSLAQAFIDQGHVIKGSRMVRALRSDYASDPRLIESAAISIAATGMIAEAIQYIEESLPAGMDWRTRFLLAILLQTDGREVEAVDLYLTLIGENTEIAGLIPSEETRYLSQRMRHGQAAEANGFTIMMQLVTQEIQQAKYSGQRLDFQRMLPSSPIEVRYRALARIASLAKMNIPAVTAKINAAAVPDLPFITDVVAHAAEGRPDYSALLEKHADRPDLLIFVLQQGYDLDDFKKSKTSLLDAMRRLKNAPGIDDKLLLMTIHGMFGEVEPWIETANAVMRIHRENMEETLGKMRTQWAGQSQRSLYVQMGDHYMHAYSLPITALPREHLHAITPAKSESDGSRLAASELIPHLNKLESPLFRAWIALQSGNENAIRKALAAKVPAIEADDFRILQTYRDVQSGKLGNACRSLLALAESSADKPWIRHWAQGSFLSLCLKLPENQRKEFDPSARKILLSLHPPAQTPVDPYAAERSRSVAEAAQRLGFTDIHKTITESLVAASSQSRTQPRSPRANLFTDASGKPMSIDSSRPAQTRQALTALDRYQNFTSEGKHRAAAHELLQWVKKQKQSGYEIERTLAEAQPSPQVRQEILALSDPGTAPGLTKRTEYVEICQALGESAKALATLQSLAAERPFDPRIQISLAFALPPQDTETAANLLKEVAHSEELTVAIQKAQRRVSATRKNDPVFAFFELLARFLELADPIPRNQQRETDAFNQLAEYFFSASYLQNASSLLSPPEENKEETPDIRKHREISQKLTRAMLRHPAHAEFAFRAMRAARWIEDPAETDALARNCLLLDTTPSGDRESYESNLEKFSSTRWLCARIQESVPQETLLPSDFLRALADNNPALPTLLVALYQIKSTNDIHTLWQSGAMSKRASPYSPAAILQQAVLGKVATVPGSIDFFAARIRALAKEDAWKKRSDSTGEYEHAYLFRAALLACRNQSAKNITSICSVIAITLYGKNPKPEAVARNHDASSLTQGIFNDLSLDSVTAIRIIRAFDSLRIPMDTYWFSNMIQQDKITDPARAIEWLDSMGFLKDSPEWSPLAHYKVQSQSSSSASEPIYLLQRAYLGDTILQNLHYKLRSTEFATQLAQRKPQTFGALITAAAIAVSSNQQKSAPFAIQAFQHAAKYLAKAPSKRLDEFAWVVHYVPYESRGILPPRLQDVIRKQRESKIADIRKQIDEQFQRTAQDPGQSTLRNAQSQIIQLAAYDLDAVIGIFQQAHKLDLENAKHQKQDESAYHRECFDNVIQSVLRNKEISPTGAFRFYRAIRRSPEGASFGIGKTTEFSTDLTNMGDAILSRYSEDIPRETPTWLRPWIAANRITGKYHTDALAVAVCYSLMNRASLMNRNSVPIDQLEKHLQLLPELSDKTREFAIACQMLANFELQTPKQLPALEQAFLRLIGHPDFDDATRLQIACCAAGRSPEILLCPAVAAAFCRVFIPHCASDFSVVDPISIYIVRSMADMEPNPESLPYLRQINEAFWSNANTPKSDAHMAIDEQTAIRFFLASIRIGDHPRAALILPLIRTSLIGNVRVILSLLLADQWELACQLLPDEASPYTNYGGNPITYNDALFKKLDAFTQASPHALRALRFEFMLIWNSEGADQRAKSAIVEKRMPELIARYRKHTPDSLALRMEMLSFLVGYSSHYPTDLEKEITELAKGIDATEATWQWLGEYQKSRSGPTHPGAYTNRVLCAAAMIQLLNGDATLFTELCDAITAVLNQLPKDDRTFPQSIARPFISSASQAIAYAVSENKTGAFAQIIRPLRDLAIATSPTSFGEEVSTTVALHDFVSHWENQPEDISARLKETIRSETQSTVEMIQFPRQTFPFIESLADVFRGTKAPYGANPEKLVTAILSRPSLAPILPSDQPWLYRLEYNKLGKIVAKLIASPPESITPEGRLVLRHYQAIEKLCGKAALDACRELVKDLPPAPSWNYLRSQCKVRMVEEMLRQKQDLAEIRTLFDSIDTAQVSNNHQGYYQSALKNLESAEARQKKKSP